MERRGKALHEKEYQDVELQSHVADNCANAISKKS